MVRPDNNDRQAKGTMSPAYDTYPPISGMSLDGPSDDQSRGGSSSGAPPTTRPGYPPPLGHDPAKIEKKKEEATPFERAARRVELPADAYELVRKRTYSGVSVRS